MAGDGLLQGLLRLGVEGGVDLQAAALPQCLPVGRVGTEGGVGGHHVLHVVAEEALALRRRYATLLRAADVERDRGGDRLVRLGLGDGAVLRHLAQHGVPALLGLLGVDDRVVPRRRLHEAGQQGGLREGEVLGVDAEVPLGGRLDPVGLLTHERDVQVVGEDLVLGEGLLQLDRVLHLLELAPDGLRLGGQHRLLVVARLVDEDVLHVLLGERRGALGDAAARRVLVDRAQHALQVDRAVLVEAVVLDVDQRGLHQRGYLVARHDRTVPAVDGGDHAAVRVVDGRSLRERGRGEVARQAVEARHGFLGPQPRTAYRGQRQPGGDHTGDRADGDQLGGEPDPVYEGARVRRRHAVEPR